MENRRSFLTRATLGVAAARASSAPAASDQVVAGFTPSSTEQVMPLRLPRWMRGSSSWEAERVSII
jgi:hypothetical protein